MTTRITNSICVLFFFLGRLQLSVFASEKNIISESIIDSRKLKSRIIGGTIAKSNMYPFYTWLNIQMYGLSESSWCGGSLIAPDVVMTAAHCIQSVISIDAWVNSTSRNYNGFEHFRKSIRTLAHPKYQPMNGNYQNDIGLVFLDSPVSDVPLVQLNKNQSLPGLTQAKVTAIGLGLTFLNFSSTESGFPDYLMEASFQAISYVECIKNAGSWMIPESDLCCYDEKKGVCFGDSGGPLLLPSSTSQNNVQVGIVSRSSKFSWEPICVKAGVPQVFTRVSYYHAWIQDNICKFSKVKPSSCTTVKPNTRRPTSKPIVKKSLIKPIP